MSLILTGLVGTGLLLRADEQLATKSPSSPPMCTANLYGIMPPAWRSAGGRWITRASTWSTVGFSPRTARKQHRELIA